MPKMELTARELGFFEEIMLEVNWSKDIPRGLEHLTLFQIDGHTILTWYNDYNRPEPDYRWCPSAVHLAAMSWLLLHQPMVTNLVLEMLTKRGFKWIDSIPKGKEERAERIVQVWKFLAEKYRGEQ